MAKHGEEESRGFTHDVFLSFRGEDTRRNFIGHLRKELRQRGINAFFDDQNLGIGEGISPALSKAIEESKISVIVFSKNYASSTWCLNELEKILECTNRPDSKQIAFPIFFHVDPSDVRHQRNGYAEAMLAHEKRFGEDSEKVKAWRSTLSKAANLKGHHIHSGSEETDDIKKIVDKVKANIAPKPLHVGEDPVGLEHRTEEVKSLLDMKPNDNTVCMLGICGLGGIGKTELAKAVYNKIVGQFLAASFLANVREKSNKINGLEDLQKTLLSEMFEGPDCMLGSTNRGMEAIKYRLRDRKVLLVLDDVDNIEQLKNLAGGCDWFGPGSRIIITTRDKGFLIGCPVVQKIYEMTELNDQHSLELFCRNAFGKSQPETGYGDMSSRAVGYAKGLPLALKVIGSNLATRKSLKAWEHALRDYERIPRKGIQDVLKVSYDVLEPFAKSVFLDIACFFKGEKMEYVEEILQEYEAASNIEELVNKSLITVEHGHLDMHDLIQAMGREIVRQEADANPGKRSRLWSHQDVIDVLADDSGSDAIQGIILDPPERIEVDWSGIAFKEMNRLRILIVRNTSFTSEPAHLPNRLRLLDWVEYPSKSFPPIFHPRSIIIFNLTKSQLTLEEPFKKYSCLTVMNFSHNQYITAMPDVSEVQRLRELRLDNCKNLIAVHESVGFLEDLAHLSVSGCTKLRNFLQSMSLPSLEVLDLDFCVKLEHFPEIVNNMNMSLKISMIQTAIEEIPDSIGKLTGLDSIEMQGCMKLKYLPSSLFKLPKVVALKIEGCSQLRESFRRFLHDVPSATSGRSILKTLYFGNSGLQDEDLQAILICFPKLEELIASKNNFVSLPACIKDSVHLTSLDVSDCQDLQDIPECSNVRILNVHRCVRLEYISELPSTVRKVDARYCSSLSRETSDMLWCQVKKDIRGLEIVMPQNEIPDWYDYRGEGGNPRFWARGKFPNITLALVLASVNGRKRSARRLLLELQLVINGRCVPRKGYYNFIVEADHVLVCDLRLLFSEEEWRGLDALLDQQEWNLVQVSYEAPSIIMLSCWGVFVYKQGTTNMGEYVQFMCPDPKCSNIDNTLTHTIVPARDPMQELRNKVDRMCLDEMFDGMLRDSSDFEERDHFAGYLDKDFAQEQHYVLMKRLNSISKQAKDVLEGKTIDDKNSALPELLEAMDKLNDKNTGPIVPYKDGGLIRLGNEFQLVEDSTSGQQSHYVRFRCKKRIFEEVQDVVQGSDPEQEKVMEEIFVEGIGAGLRVAQRSFPSLDIDITMATALDKGNTVRWSQPVRNQVEMKFIEGIINGLKEAKLSFPTLDIEATLSQSGIQIKLEEEDSTSGNQGSSGVQGSDPQQQERLMEIFSKGMGEGLREAQKSFPSLDIDITMATALDKGNRVRWSQPAGNQLERKYVEGIINGLKEAKLSFPTLDVDATLNTIMSSSGGQDLSGAQIILEKASTSGNQGCSGVQGSDPRQQERLMEIFLEGMGEGLREAQRSFPSLDIDITMATALDKGNRVRWSQPVGNQVEMKYMEGIINGLKEAKLSFPTLDVEATLKTIMLCSGCRLGMQIKLEEEASTSGNQGSSGVQGSDPQQQERLMEIFSEGMGEGLREAQKSFPSLDIDITMATALDKCDRFRNRWPQRPEMEIYTEGIVNGLEEARQSFPTLDVEATTNTVLSKGPYKGPNRALPTFRLLDSGLDWTKVKVPSTEQDNCESEDKSELFYCKLVEEHKALRMKFEELENKDSCLLPAVKDRYNELIEKLLNSPQSALSISKSCHNLDAVLKGRDEELQRLSDAGIDEGFQNSRDIEGLMYAIYLKGLMDGHLEARMVLLALDMDDRRTAPVIKENEEHVTHHEAVRDEHATADNEDPGETIGVVADIPSSTTDSEVDNPRDTSTPSGSQLLEEFGHLFF